MSNIILDLIQVLVLGVISGCLWAASKNREIRTGRGWNFVLAGSVFILLGTLMEAAHNFPGPAGFILNGNAEHQAFLEKAVYLVGYILFATGIVRWLPTVSSIISMKKEATRLLRTNEELEREIAERRRAEHELRTNKEMLQNILDAIRDGITVLDGDLNILRVNRALERLNSHFPSIERHKCYEVYHGRSTPCNSCPSLRALREGTQQTKTVHMTGRDGETRWFDLYAYPFFDEPGDAVGVVEFARDITDRVRSEKALEKAREAAEKAQRAAEVANRAKSEFLASMSHELRTPLNAILGYAQILLQDRDAGEKQLDGLKTIRQSGEHLLSLLNDILDLSRIEAGRMELEPREFQLESFIKNIADIFQVKADRKKIRFAHETRGDMPEAVRGDEVRLRQVLFNLLGNAIKFTGRGEVIFRAGAGDDASGARGRSDSTEIVITNPSAPVSLFFEIEDTGPGIRDDDLDTIFSPFKQVGSRLGKSQGSGLGLAISKKLVDIMGGSLTVESVFGKGSTFRIDIDLPPVRSMSGAGEPKQSPVVGYKGPRRKVLVVDDTSENRALLSFLLRPIGFEVAGAVDGREGVEKAREISPDLIFMDRYMPIMDGLEAVRRIRSFSPPQDVVVIGISASAFGEDRRQSLDAGCDDFITKPFNIKDVLEKLRRWLKLEWIHEDEAPPVEEPVGSSPSLLPPPADELDILIGFANVGDIRAIRGCAENMERSAPELKPFAVELNRLAKSFQIDEIRNLLKSFGGE